MFFDNDEAFQIPKSKFQGAVDARPSASSLNIAYGIKIDMAIGRSPYSTLPNTVQHCPSASTSEAFTDQRKALKMNSHHIRVPLVEQGTKPELKEIEARILQERGRISLLYQVLLNSAPIAQGWEAMLTAVRNQTSVPADLRELMILRVAVLNKASFEFEAHVPHALKAGVPQSKIDDVRQMVLSGNFSDEEKC